MVLSCSMWNSQPDSSHSNMTTVRLALSLVLVQALQGLYQYMLRLPMVLRSIPIYTT